MGEENNNSGYWSKVGTSVRTLATGLKLTFKHVLEARAKRAPIGVADEGYFEQKTGRVTLQYPTEALPTPDIGRYRLHNEIDDCIVCDKCAKICPVDCIDIEPILSPDVFGETSDGTAKRIYAAKFDIDMAKCCFCGLCTTVCPTECLTMTKAYDFSEFDVKDHNYAFAEMTPLEILEKKKAFDEFSKQKAAAKAASGAKAPGAAKAAMPKKPAAAKPSVKPNVKKPAAPSAQAMAKALMEKKTKDGNASGDAPEAP